MANGSVRRWSVKALSHQRFVPVANGQRHKVEGLALQGRSDRVRHRAYDSLQIVGRKHDLTGGGIADTVGCLVDSRIANNLLRGAELRIDGLTHVIILTYSCFIGRYEFMMKKFFLSAGIGLASGVITFFLSVAFLCFVLLALRAASHSTPDMTLAYKAAVPVAILGAICGFTIALIRVGRPRSAR